MHPQRRILATVVLVGGMAVLVSYAYGLIVNPDLLNKFWGGVPPALQPAYSVSMLLATAGFFVYTFFLLFCVDPDRARIADRLGYSLFSVLYLLILVPSALWMPLTAAMLEHGSGAIWSGIRLTLGVVGLGSIGLCGALLALRPRRPLWLYGLAVAGGLAFCLQTAVLDALVWTALFPV